MPINQKERKTQARLAMHSAVPSFWKVSAVFLLLTAVLSIVVDAVVPPVNAQTLYARGGVGWISLFVTILMTLYLFVMRYGFDLWALRTSRGQQAGIGTLMEGFGSAGRVLMMNLLIILRVLLWIFLLTIGLTIVVYASMYSLLFASTGVAYTWFFLLVAVIYAAVFSIMLRYALAPYLLADYPDDGPGAAVRRSVEMMRGRKWQLFKLYFSFLGWYLINVLLTILTILPFLISMFGSLSLAIQDPNALAAAISTSVPISIATGLVTLPLSLWLTPYVQLSVVGFYRSILEQPVTPSPIGPDNSMY